MALAAFALQAEVAFARHAIAAHGHLLAIHRELDLAVVALDAVVVPLRRRLHPLLAGKAAASFFRRGRHRGHRRAPDREDVAMRGEPLPGAVRILRLVAEVEN